MPPQPSPMPSTIRTFKYRTIVLAVRATLCVVGVGLWAGIQFGYVWLAPLQYAYDDAYDIGEECVPDDLRQVVQGLEEIATSGSSFISI